MRWRDVWKGKGRKKRNRGLVKGKTKEKRSMWKESNGLMDGKKREKSNMKGKVEKEKRGSVLREEMKRKKSVE